MNLSEQCVLLWTMYHLVGHARPYKCLRPPSGEPHGPMLLFLSLFLLLFLICLFCFDFVCFVFILFVCFVLFFVFFCPLHIFFLSAFYYIHIVIAHFLNSIFPHC